MNHRNAAVPADEAQTEAAIVAAGKAAPRITPADIDAQITSEYFFTAREGVIGAFGEKPETVFGSRAVESMPPSLGVLTFCVLVLRNGFTVTGESACASPENFDPQIGRDIARRNARDKIWSLEGYQLRTRLHEQEQQRMTCTCGPNEACSACDRPTTA